MRMIRIKTRRFLLLLMLAALMPGCGDKEKEASKPNVLLVIIDTLRADHCSTYGYFRDTTPNLGRLAREGLLFQNAWSQAPWTTPSMVSMFTGRYVVANYNVMPPGTRILAERFKEGGYSTAALVANPILYSGTGFERGFDTYETGDVTKITEELVDTALTADRFGARARELLTKELKEPFFCWLHLFDPHEPYRAPENFMEVANGFTPGASVEDYRARQPPYAKKPIERKDMRNLEMTIRRYDAEVAFADTALGDILDALDARGIDERTLVVVTSDHGEGLFAHACYPEDKSQGHISLFQRHRKHVYEEAVHVPLVIRGPNVPKNVRYQGLVENLDLYPTLLAASGLEEDSGSHGSNLFQQNRKGKDAVFAFGTGDHAVRVRTGEKLIHPVRKAAGDDRKTKRYLLTDDHPHRKPQMFTLSDDPGERNNLYDEDSNDYKVLRKALYNWQELHKNALSDTNPPTKEMLERLKMLGYLR